MKKLFLFHILQFRGLLFLKKFLYGIDQLLLGLRISCQLFIV